MGRHHYREGDEPVPGYRLKRWLGEGGFGVAWMATAPGGTEVAMKMIDLGAKNALKEFRALRLVKRIRHPNLTPILAFWLKDSEGNVLDDSVADSQELLSAPSKPSALKDTMLADSDAWRSRPAELIMAMGLGDKTLSDRLDECVAAGLEGIPPDELLEYLEASAKAIDYLNSAQHNIQHCDIKPQNILIVGGAAQVCDFGLARAIQDNRATKVAVSYAYAAPESFQSKPSHATDQYSLAITYVELRTGALPFDDESAIGVMNAHLNGALNLSRLPEGEREVIRRATAVDPDERHDSALKMVRALRRAFESAADLNAGKVHEIPVTPLSTSVRVSTAEEVVPGYRLLRQILRSSTEEVWEAAAPGGKRVALVIRELAESAAALDLEALSVVLRMGHPNLTEMLAFWLVDHEGTVLPDEQLSGVDRSRLGKLVLAGKLSGSTLMQLMSERRQRTGKGIPVSELLPMMSQAATALDFLNSRQHKSGQRKVGVLHCNVQPSNLLLYGQTVRLGNFGRARALGAETIEDSIAAAGFEMAYTPPEVFDGHLTRWTDQYGLALSYIHLRSGKPAFDAASSTTRLIQLHRSGELDFRDLPPSEVEILRRATAIVPSDRFDSCVEFIDELRRTGVGASSGPAASGASPAEKRKTEGIVSAATEVLDISLSTQDTAPPDGSVIETQPLVEPQRFFSTRTAQSPDISVTSDWSEDDQVAVTRPVPRERESNSSGGQGASDATSKSRSVLLIAAAITAALLLGAMAWPYLSALVIAENHVGGANAKGVVVKESGEADLATEDLDAADMSDDAYVIRLDSLFDRAEALPPNGTVDPTTLVDELLTLKSDPAFKGAFRQRRREDAAFVVKLTDQLRALASANDVAPPRRVELFDRLIALNPQQVTSYLELARWKLASEDLESARQTLAAADALNPQRADRDEWLFLGSQIDVHDPQAAPADINRALTNLRQLLEVGAFPSTSDVANMSRDLVALCLRDESYLDPATAVMKVAYARVPDEIVKQAYAALLVERLERQLRSSADPNYETWLAETLTAESIVGDSPLVGLVRAECLLETFSDRLSANQFAEIVQLVERPGDVPDELVPYASYVRALARASNPRGGEWSQVAESLDAARAGISAEHSIGFASPHRRIRAGELFAEAGHHLRSDVSSMRPVERIVANPFGDEATARRAALLLQQSRQLLSDRAEPGTLADLALAAYHGTLPADVVLGAIDSLRANLDAAQDDRLPIRWVIARSQADDTAGRRTAVTETATLVEEFSKSNRIHELDAKDATRLYEDIVAPAVIAADMPGTLEDGSTSKSAARLYATKGHLFYTPYPDLDWGLTSEARGEAVFEAYNRAIELDEASAEYLVGRAQVRQYLPAHGGADAAASDLARAIELDPAFAPAHYLRAVLFTRQATASGLSNDQRAELFEKARQACDDATAAAAPDNPERANYLIALANAHVNIANYTTDSDAKEAHLLDAEKFAQEAVDDRDYPYLERAYRVLGNAQEDLAWIVARTNKEKVGLERYYEEAVKSFELARNLRPDLAEAWRDLGRAQYKWAADSVPDAEHAQNPKKAHERWELLTLAEQNTEQALAKDQSLNDARYWSAMARFKQGQYPEACERFSQYFSEDALWVGFYYAEYVNAAFQGLQDLQDALDKGLKRDAPEVRARVEAARACAARLTSMSDRNDLGIEPQKSAMALRAMADAVDGNADAAFAELEQAGPERDKSTAADLDLLASRIHTRLLASQSVARAVNQQSNSKPFEVFLDSNRLAALAAGLSVDQRVEAYTAAAWAYYKAYHFPLAAVTVESERAQQKVMVNLYRLYAIQALRNLIAADPHHPNGWNARLIAATLIKEEITNSAPNAERLATEGYAGTTTALREEAQSYVRYALEVAPEAERNRLRRLLTEITALK